MAVTAAAAASSAASASVGELVLAKETLQVQLHSERKRLHQLDQDYHQLQQQEQLLQSKIASMVASAMQKESDHAAALAELRQQLQQQLREVQQQQQQNGIIRADNSTGPLYRASSVENSLSEGDLAQQVTTYYWFLA